MFGAGKTVNCIKSAVLILDPEGIGSGLIDLFEQV